MKITLVFSLFFYWLEFNKFLSLALLLPVPRIVYINLVELIITVSRYWAERHPPPIVYLQHDSLVERFSLLHRYSNSLFGDACVCDH